MSHERQRTGKIGEALARAHLEEAGYTIEAANFRHLKAEIDLVCRPPEGEALVFVEVKTRRSAFFGEPARFHSATQKKHLARAAAAYCRKVEHDWEMRFDVIGVYLRSEAEGDFELRHYEDVFWPGLY